MKIAVVLILSQILILGSTHQNQYSNWDVILKSNVDKTGRVDYQGIKADKRFKKCLTNFENTNINSLGKNEKLSFLINAYNAFVIKNVLEHKNLKSPLDDKDFFKSKKFKLDGKILSLDEIEHNYVLKIEPALSHFGLVCGAVSCPKLIPKAYTADNVISQLKVNAAEFINNKNKNYLDRKNKILYLSQIFNWFNKYFEYDNSSAKKFVLKYINQKDKEFIQKNNVSIKFIEYDWKLNSQSK